MLTAFEHDSRIRSRTFLTIDFVPYAVITWQVYNLAKASGANESMWRRTGWQFVLNPVTLVAHRINVADATPSTLELRLTKQISKCGELISSTTTVRQILSALNLSPRKNHLAPPNSSAAQAMSLKAYLYPTAIILVVSVGSIYGASLKSQNQLSQITESIQDPQSRIKELERYREQLVAQRILQERKLRNWKAKIESATESS